MSNIIKSPPGAIGKMGKSNFADSPNDNKSLYIHPLCGGGQSSTHHGAYVDWEYLDFSTVRLSCRGCGKEEIHNLSQHGGPRVPGPGKSLGRNPLSDEPTEKHTISAPASFWRYIEALAPGNRSEALRLLVEYHQQNAT